MRCLRFDQRPEFIKNILICVLNMNGEVLWVRNDMRARQNINFGVHYPYASLYTPFNITHCYGVEIEYLNIFKNVIMMRS